MHTNVFQALLFLLLPSLFLTHPPLPAPPTSSPSFSPLKISRYTLFNQFHQGQAVSNSFSLNFYDVRVNIIAIPIPKLSFLKLKNVNNIHVHSMASKFLAISPALPN
jgi:hypothetical protein